MWLPIRMLLSAAAGVLIVTTILQVQQQLGHGPRDILVGIIGTLAVLLVWVLTARVAPRHG
jgi:hypothetical protein